MKDVNIIIEEIAKKFGLTSERIRQIKEGALSKLKTVYYDDVKLLNSNLSLFIFKAKSLFAWKS